MQENLFEHKKLVGSFRDRLHEVPTVALEAAVMSCRAYSSVARRLGLSQTFSNNDRKWLISRLDYERIDHSHLGLGYDSRRGGGVIAAHASMSDEEVLETYFIKDAPFSWETIKKLTLLRGFLPERCSECGIGPKWNGISLVLQCDHINGDNSDQNIENLRFLCPNCHTQTDTFGGRNQMRIDWADYLEVKAREKKFDIPPVDEG